METPPQRWGFCLPSRALHRVDELGLQLIGSRKQLAAKYLAPICGYPVIAASVALNAQLAMIHADDSDCALSR